MADKTVIIKLDVQEAGAISSIEDLNNSLKKLDKTSDEYAVILKKIQVEETKLASIQKKRAGTQKSVTKALDKQSDATGSATAATMELSRVVSDAPYGIRGMANNITQLVSQLGSASTKAGGLGAALKLMGKQLMGPLGIVFLITAAVSALDYFYGAATKADKSINSVAESAAKSASALKILVKANDSGTMSTEETAKAVKKANSEYKDLNIQVGKNGKITDESVLAINRKITSLENLARATALQGLVEEKFAKLIPLENKLKTQEEEALVKLRIKGINSIKEAQAIADDKKFTAEKGYVTGVLNQANFTKSKIDGIQKDIDELIETIPNIDDLFKGTEGKDNGKVKKISPFKTPKELELDVKNNEKALIEFNKKLEEYDLKTEMNNKLSAAKTEKERFDIKKLYATKLLTAQIDAERETLKLNKSTELEIAKAKTAAHIADIKRAFELFKIKTELDKNLTPKQKESLIGGATGKMFDAIGQADKEIEDTEKGINDRYKPIFKLFEEVKVARFAALFSGFKDKEKQEDELAKLESYAKKAKEILNGIGDFVDAEYQRELSIEQNKTNVLNNELNQRLLNENLSKEQRKTIQNEIAQNDEKLRKKQESIEKKRFKAQKAINIATALIDTGVAAVKALKNNGGVPTGLPAMFGTIALGLAQVATIARTKFQSSAGSSPVFAGGGGGSSSGGGTGRAEASFNIVGGRTKEDALLGAIQAKFDQPVRAYVVSGDVTSQQELDRVIVSSSSL